VTQHNLLLLLLFFFIIDISVSLLFNIYEFFVFRISSIDYEDTKFLCGKDKFSSIMNDVNWLRHIKACDIRKRRHKNSVISTFFTKFSKKTFKGK